ncbi:fluoride efflux transporter FluC [Bifidobacterium xylocopae]|uniref:Fluoride-specific ion channel FluC n=1 Tax=Bifidobacterium xylocopae TaxID=2493119 RepID=A0A366KE54_9BIFI|nr:CrcB family protein [Bifidobacterium xylocopae]RBQ00006.1 hypothetical protein CRD59_00630 [Bifidobacterium xylocopae]
MPEPNRRHPLSPHIDLPVLLLVCAGGAVGTGLRYALSALPAYSWYFQTGTFAANMLACLAFGLLSAYMARAGWIDQRRRELVSRTLGMGVCGGLSTMSTLTIEVFTTARDLHLWSALAYLLATFACGIGLAWLGGGLGRRLARLREGTR